MHRSGTSAVAGLFQEAGLFFGPSVDIPSPYSPKGHRENPLITLTQDMLFQLNGGGWRNPVECKDFGMIAKQRKVIIHGMSQFARQGHPCQIKARWAFKCCRVLFSLDHWLKEIPHLQLIGVFRHPLEVAVSLAMRDGIGPMEGIALWQKYNERLLHYHKQDPFPLINFSSEDFLAQVHDALSQIFIDEKPHRFYNPKYLKAKTRQVVIEGYGTFSEIDVPQGAMDMYEELVAHTTTPQEVAA
jgi:hypothetical protein